MKKILSFLITVVFIGFAIAVLYVFGLPPFQTGGPFYPAAKQTQQSQTALPDFLTQDKIARNQTYEEHMTRGQLLETNTFYSLAIAEYQAANALSPKSADPFMKIGRIQLLTADYPKAETNFKKAIELQPGNVDAQIYLGRTLLQERKIDDARVIFNKMDPTNNQTVAYYQGILDAYAGDYDNSKKLLDKAISIGTSTDLTKKAQNYLAAFSEFDFNQEGAPTHLKTLLGRSFAQTGEYQLAIPLLYDVIKNEKDYRDAWIILGYCYLNTSDYQDSVEALEQAKKLDPQDSQTFFYLGLAYYGKSDLQQAAADLEQAKSLGFQPVIQIDQKLAEIYLEMKNYEKSAQLYENVVALNDTDINYYIRPIWIYLEKTNEPIKAVSLAQKAYNNHPNQPMSYNLIGWAEVGNNQFAEAQKNLQKALDLDPKLDAAYLNFGLLWEKEGQADKALSYYSKAYKLGNGNSITNAAAERYNNLIAKVKTNTNIGQANIIGPN